VVVAALVIVYAIALWIWFRPDFIQNWRESDSLTIARHLAEPGSSIFYPRIDWGGSGPGYVEAEFQLYTWIVSRFLMVFGDVEWPGQLVSLTAVALTAWVVFVQLASRYGPVPAAIGVAGLLSSRTVVQAATTIQPEALCLLLYSVAWFAFLKYADTGDDRHLWLYGVAGGMAMLVKPTAAHLGIASFLLLLMQSPQLLRRRAVWIAWGLMVAALVLHLGHARSIYLEYGNTFGVLSGGDSKIPRLEHLLVPSLLLRAAINSVMWGVGVPGAVAVVAAIVLRRKNSAPIAALVVANAVWTLVALRYTSRAGGNHYHLLGAVLAAQAIAMTLASLAMPRVRTYARVLAVCALALAMERSLSIRAWTRHNVWDQSAVAVAKALQRHSQRGDLIVVRSVAVQYDTYWKTISNFEDPRVFNMTRTHGWPIGKEVTDPSTIDHAFRQGARFYVEPEERPAMPAFDAWLAGRARLVETTSYGGKVYELLR
jgi:4-amino-4-deoxy-L-arabinose transferase-like glycosyltransferase